MNRKPNLIARKSRSIPIFSMQSTAGSAVALPTSSKATASNATPSTSPNKPINDPAPAPPTARVRNFFARSQSGKDKDEVVSAVTEPQEVVPTAEAILRASTHPDNSGLLLCPHLDTVLSVSSHEHRLLRHKYMLDADLKSREAAPAVNVAIELSQSVNKPPEFISPSAPSPTSPSLLSRSIAFASLSAQRLMTRSLPPVHTAPIVQVKHRTSHSSSHHLPPLWMSARRIVIIGIHGWAPLGGALSDAQKSNSYKFCVLATAAVRKMLNILRDEHQQALPEVDIFPIPLSGHGTIDARVTDYMETQLPPFLSQIRDADVVLTVCHSQGCAVAALVLERLMASGFIRPGTESQSVCMLAMSGVHHGPFPDTPSDLLAATRELFELGRPNSSLAQRHALALCALLNAGVKCMLLGAWFDQVVPLFSACASAVEVDHSLHRQSKRNSAPVTSATTNLLRGVFVQAEFFHNDFLTLLVQLCLHMSNLGLFQSDLIAHLSGYLRGRLLQRREGAHSRIHSNADVFAAAAHWFLAGPRGVPCPSLRPAPSSTMSHTQSAEPMTSSTHSSASTNVRCKRTFQLSLRTAAHYSIFMTDTFGTSDLNRYICAQLTQELLNVATTLSTSPAMQAGVLPNSTVSLIQTEVAELRAAYGRWRPDSRPLQLLCRALEVVFPDARSDADVEGKKIAAKL